MRRTTKFLTALLVAIAGLAFNATLQAQTITTIAGIGSAVYSGDGGAATSAGVENLTGIAVDVAGNVYISDNSNNKVRKIAVSTGIISLFAGNGTAGYTGDGGSAVSAELNSPSGLATDAAGNVYIADFGNNVIRMVNTSGTISTVAGNYSLGGGFGGDGGLATSAPMYQPIAVAIDPTGNMYIVDQGNDRIRMVNLAGVISTIAGNGTTAGTGDGGAATLASFNQPSGIAADGAGNVYVADYGNNKIRIINSAHYISTFAGTGSGGFSGDGGTATAAKLFLPIGVAVDMGGNVYIADFFNYRIRKVSPAGTISTVAGNGTAGYSGDGSPATSYELNLPSALACDNAGNVYIDDNGNYRVRELLPTACSGTPTAGSATGLPSTVTTTATTFILSLSGATAAAGLTYQWQSSPTGSSWANISGATYYPYTTTESSTTYYRCVVTCSGSSATSGSAIVTYGTGSYCTDGIGSPCAEGAGLSEFHIYGISGTSILDNASCSSSSGYQNLTSLSVTLRQGGTYNSTIAGTSAPSPGLGNQVWIDFNDDGTFATSETIGYGADYNPTISTETLSIPYWANTGSHRMRILQVYNGADRYPPTYLMDPCSVSYSFGEARDYTVVIVAPPNCSGTPVAGAAVSTEGVACASTSFTLSLSGATDTVGLLTYQWQSSADGTTWTNIVGAEFATYTTTETTPTYFRCILTCSVGGASSTSTAVHVGYISACYCTPTYYSGYAGYGCTTGGTSAYYISNFYVNGESGTSLADAAPCSTTGYEDETSESVTLMQSISYLATCVIGTSSIAMSAQAWIDYNDNGTFENSESVGGSGGITGTGTFIITPSLTATVGTHRMRVFVVYNSIAVYPSLAPCGSSGYYYADCRDYSVNIIALPVCSGTPSGGTAISSTAEACPGTPFTLNLTSGTSASSLTYQWQSSTDGTTWSTIAGATTLPFSLTESAATYYQCITTCSVGGASATSTSVHVDYVGYCYCVPAFYDSVNSCSTYHMAFESFHTYGYSGTSLLDNLVCTGTGYVNNSGLSVTYLQGAFYSDTMTTGDVSYALNNMVWIDYNDNGTFEATECIAHANSYTGTGIDTFTISATATLGTHRMRIVQIYAAASPGLAYPDISPCPTTSVYYYGEARDYTAIIVSPTPTLTPSVSSYTFPTTISVGSCSTPTAISITGSFLTPATGNITVTSASPFSVCSSVSGTYVSSYTIAYTGGTLASTQVYVKFCPTSSGPASGSLCFSGGGASQCAGLLGHGSGSSCTSTISTIAGNGTGGYVSDGGPATGTEINGPNSVVVDAAGNIYISDDNNSRIRKVNTSGVISTFAGNGTAGFSGDGGAATAAEIHRSAYIALDVAGNLYIADQLNNRIRKVDLSGNISTVVGNGTAGFSGDGGAATAAEVNTPYGIAFDASGNMYIADELNARIRKVNTSGIITTYAGTGTTSYGGDGGQATAAQLNFPNGIAIDGSGNVFFTDNGNHRIRKINATTGIISTYAGTGTAGFSGDGGAATSATISSSGCGLKFDAAGNLYYADQNNNRVRVISPSGTINTYAGNGSSTTSGDGGPATAAGIDGPVDMIFDYSGNLLIAEYTGNRIRKIATTGPTVAAISGPTVTYTGSTITLTDGTSGGTWTSSNSSIATVSGGVVGGVSAGTVTISYSLTNSCGTTAQTYYITVYSNCGIITTIAGDGTAGYTGEGAATSVELDGPSALAVDGSGNVYVADQTNNRIRKITAGGTISTIAGTGTAGYGGDGGAGVSALLNSPGGICIDASGNLYITDYNNNRVRKLTPGGTITTVAGGASAGYSGDGGAATSALLNHPVAVAADAFGNLFICDAGSNHIRKVTAAGFISTIGGNGTSGYTGDGIAATSAEFAGPDGIAVDAYGNVYISDRGNERVRMINTSGMISTFAGNGTGGFSGDGGAAGSAELFRPAMLAFDGLGNLFLADQDNDRVRKITPAGIITTVAGSASGAYSGDGGPATNAGLAYNGGIAVDAGDNLYIACIGDNRVRKVSSGEISVAAISGPTTVVAGNTITLTDATGGGTWTSGNTSVATVSGGTVGGVAAGNTFITYSISNSCGTTGQTKNDTVSSGVCTGAVAGTFSASVITACSVPFSSTLTATGYTASGPGISYQWQSSTDSATWSNVSGATTNTYTATVSSTIYYRFTVTCSATGAVSTAGIQLYQTLVPSVPAIGGTPSVCTGSTTTLTNTTSGGTWTSVTTSLATVEATTGIVHGVAVGTDVISYTVTNMCGTTSASIDVAVTTLTAVGAITGPTSVCVAHSITLVDGTSGGTWSSGSGSVGGFSGAVFTGYSADTTSVYYTVTGACGTSSASYLITVQPLPNAGTITGTLSVCPGSTTLLADAITGGAWNSGNTAIATVNSSGLVFGVTGGTVAISYTVTNSCGTAITSASVTVNPLPSPGVITGSPTICIGSVATLTESASGGTWSSSNSSIATIDPSSGSMTGVSAGSAHITYTVTTACGTSDTTFAVTVNSSPSAGTIAGAASVCQGANITLTDGVSGGTWSSDNLAVATVNASGKVFGVLAGIVDITYTVTGSCGTATAAKTITVNPLPNAAVITGSGAVCVGATLSLADTATGGSWSSSNNLVATVDASGNVTGVLAGSVTITYLVSNSCGSATATHAVTVTGLPSAGTITGATNVCIGATTGLTDATSGGSWSSSNTSVATVTGTGLVTGVAAGTTIISYSVSNSCGTTAATDTITASLAPSAGTITGVSAICQAATTTLTDGVSGGTWSSGNMAVATVNASGTVTGVSGGNATISYTVTGSCGTVSATKLVLVTPLPNAGTITGTMDVCVGGTTTLSDTISGGTWSSSTSSIGTVSAAGVVSGVSGGNTTISYSVTNTCGTAIATAIVTVQVAPLTGVITGTSLICAGLSTPLSDTVSGGAWTTSNMAVATINGAGVMTGVAAGSATITYTVTNSCGSLFTTYSVTIDPAVSAGTISGVAAMCPGATASLTDGVSGGTWTSSNVAVATVSASGLVSAVSVGSTIVSYAVTNVCGTAYSMDTITVDPMPNAGTITGLSVICTGGTTTLTDASSGGTWSSSNLAIATITAGGVVNGVTAGSATITYTVTNSCGTADTTLGVTVNTAPSAGTISGVTSICSGTTTTLVDGVSGGTWSSSNTTIATVSAAGLVRGISAGTVNISYLVTTSCGTSITHISFTVTTSPSAGTISGITSICAGSTSTLTDGVSGGTWSSSNTAVASVNTSGLVRGVTAGTAIISYAVTASCGTSYATANVTVTTSSPSAGTITGASSVCVGSPITLSDTVSGGTWSSSDTTKATVSAAGVVTGVAAGSVTITYTDVFSCGTATATKAVTVNPLPSAGTISGVTSVCTGSSVGLTDATSGGTWSSSAVAIATVDASGNVYGVTVGSATITYTVTNSCGTATATDAITVITGASAGTISGTPTTFCAGAATTLSDAASGGTWSSSNTAVATVSASGLVVGVSGGSAIISYSVSSSCGTAVATQNVTINPLPNTGTITGTPTVCIGATTTLADTATGGTWSSSNNTIATVSAAGVVSGVSAGTVTISYVATNSCGTSHSTISVTVTSTPSVGTITGTTSVCLSSGSTLSDTVSGGTWSSSNTAVATVDASGNVTGVSAGVATISYTITSSCGTGSAMATVTVISGVTAGSISGGSTVCASASMTLTDGASGGAWSSSNTAVATVDASGNVFGVSGGTATISYTVTTSCGTANALKVITVSPLPSVGTISGGNTVCSGSTLTLSDGVSGGTWSSSTTSVATVDGSGNVSGVSTGTSVISYSITNSCGTSAATDTITVNAAPSAGFISGTTTVCIGTISSLSESVSGGTWSTSNAAIASINASGVVTGVSNGTATISYTVTNTCGSVNATTTVTVSAGSAGTITGTTAVCLGSTTTLSDAVTGGSWTSSNPSVATISAGGVVSGLSVGSATITYTVTTTCGSDIVTATVTVSPTPDAGSISGLTFICTGTTSSLTDGATGGTWSSSNASVASVDGSGNVTGVASGAATISYTVTNSCGSATATAAVTVGSSAFAGTIMGASSVCTGTTTTLSDATLGGTWSSSNPSIASISSTGVVSGVSAGSATITYTIATSCGTATTTSSISVISGSASAGTISGATTVCAGATTTLTDATSGGTWSSASPSVATVDASGNVTGVSGGTATISYTVTSACSSAVATANITVNPLPTVSAISGTTSVCVGTSTTLTDGTAGGSWSSTNTSVASISASGVVSGIAAGTTTISYSVTNSCGTTAATAMVTVSSGTASAGTISGTTSICARTTSTLTDAVTGGSWSSSNTAIASVDASGSVFGVSAGTVTISYMVSSTCSSATATTSFTVNPGADAGSISGAVGVCIGSSVTLTDAVTGGTWSSSNPSVASINSAGVVTGTGAGVATISYSVSGSGGCGGYTTHTFIAGNSTLPSLTVTPGSATLCGGSPVHLTTGSTSIPVLYQWYKNGVAIAGATSLNYLATTAGGYTATITNGCATDTLNSASVLAAPVPVISVAGASTLTTGSFATYQWYLNGTAITGATNESYVYSATGVYTVRVTDVNGCTGVSAGHTITSGSGVTNVNGETNVTIYPNPATAIVHISADVKVNVVIVTAVGKVVIDQKDATEVNMAGMANGLYMIMVYDENNTLLKVAKLIKAE